MERSTRRRMPGARARIAACRICGDPIPAGRRTECSDRCAAEARIRRSPEFAADLFRFKYGTRCASCGQDEALQEKTWLAAHALLQAQHLSRLLKPFPTFQLDHIRPVADGGGECGLENYRLMCRLCHQGVTTAWQRERARRRKSPGPYTAAARQRRGYRVPLPQGGAA